MFKKIKKVFCKCKAFVVGAVATASVAAMSAIASAADTSEATGIDFDSLMTEAGTSLQTTLSGLVKTMIPVILGITSAGLVVFGLIALIRLAKKIFGKVAG